MSTKKDDVPKRAPSWHSQQEKVLKNWAEQAGGYRLIHDDCYRKYKKQTARFTIPVIIMSTVTGTANFAQDSFPVSWQSYVPSCIGLVNLLAAILTTIAQYLKVQELQESNRVSSVSFAKLNRDITVELNLPVKERGMDGADFLRSCQTEMDRLIEQSAPIPKDIISGFRKSKRLEEGVSLPDIFSVKKLDIFKDKERKTSILLADAAKHLKEQAVRARIQNQRDKLQRELELQFKRDHRIPEPTVDIETPTVVEDPEEEIVPNVKEITSRFEEQISGPPPVFFETRKSF